MKKVIINGHGTMLGTILSLLKSTSEDLMRMKRTLAEEYGIEPLIVAEPSVLEKINLEEVSGKPVIVLEARTLRKVSPEEMERVFELKPGALPEISELVLRQNKRSLVKPYVPKTIGKPCSAPHRSRK